jgi:hypothetical protein
MSTILILIPVLHDFLQLDSDLIYLMPPQVILPEKHISLHVQHIEGAPDDSAEHVGVPEFVMLNWQNYVFGKGVVRKDKAEAFVFFVEILDFSVHSKEHLEGLLGDNFSGFSEIVAEALSLIFGKKVINKSTPYVITHLIKQGVDLFSVPCLLDKFMYKGSISES